MLQCNIYASNKNIEKRNVSYLCEKSRTIHQPYIFYITGRHRKWIGHIAFYIAELFKCLNRSKKHNFEFAFHIIPRNWKVLEIDTRKR